MILIPVSQSSLTMKKSLVFTGQILIAFETKSKESSCFPSIIELISANDTPSSFAASSGLRFKSLSIPKKLLPILFLSSSNPLEFFNASTI